MLCKEELGDANVGPGANQFWQMTEDKSSSVWSFSFMVQSQAGHMDIPSILNI